jgi:hypothetical protein
VPQQAIDAAKAGRLVEAIKIVRASGNFGLVEAKGIVEQLQRSMPRGASMPHGHQAHHAQLVRRAGGLGPGEVPRLGGGGKWFILAVVAGLLILLALNWH